MRIAILDGDPTYTDFVSRALAPTGHTCCIFTAGRALQRCLHRETFDLLVLDRKVSDPSGEEIMKWVRASQTKFNLPIVFLTFCDDEAGIEKILDAGADDYIVKPISASIFRARIDAILRRSYKLCGELAVRTYGKFCFDLNCGKIYVGGDLIRLTQKEFELALLLFQHLDQPVSRVHILECVWKQVIDLQTRTIDTHISVLRAKLALRPEHGYRLVSIYGYGYRLDQIG